MSVFLSGRGQIKVVEGTVALCIVDLCESGIRRAKNPARRRSFLSKMMAGQGSRKVEFVHA